MVRNGFSRDLADLLVADLKRHTTYFDKLTSPLPGAGGKELQPLRAQTAPDTPTTSDDT